MSGWMRWFYEIVLIIGALSSWIFIIWYSARFTWWHNALGAHLISFSTCVALFYTWYTVLTLWPTIPERNIVRLALFVAMTVTIVWRLIVFIKVAHQIALQKKENTP